MIDREQTKVEKESLRELAFILAHTDDVDLIERFLVSLLTPNELEEITLRWALVKLIDQGVSQRKISQQLGLSLCKITRGSKELKKKDSAFAKLIHRYRELTEEQPRHYHE
jgi:TrpR family trp operon transcriptional repressor